MSLLGIIISCKKTKKWIDLDLENLARKRIRIPDLSFPGQKLITFFETFFSSWNWRRSRRCRRRHCCCCRRCWCCWCSRLCECDTRHRKNVNFSGKKFISETSHKILLKIKSETEMRNRLPTKLTENSGMGTVLNSFRVPKQMGSQSKHLV